MRSESEGGKEGLSLRRRGLPSRQMNADITSPQRRNKLASRLPEEDADGCKEYDLTRVALIHADGQDGAE